MTLAVVTTRFSENIEYRFWDGQGACLKSWDHQRNHEYAVPLTKEQAGNPALAQAVLDRLAAAVTYVNDFAKEEEADLEIVPDGEKTHFQTLLDSMLAEGVTVQDESLYEPRILTQDNLEEDAKEWYCWLGVPLSHRPMLPLNSSAPAALQKTARFVLHDSGQWMREPVTGHLVRKGDHVRFFASLKEITADSDRQQFEQMLFAQQQVARIGSLVYQIRAAA